MGDLRRQFGFWRALGRMRLSDLVAPEIVFGTFVGAGIAVLLARVGDLNARTAMAGDYLVIAAALLGIVFAGFALVIGLLSDEYLRWLEDTNGGVVGFLSPFMVSVGFQVGALISAVVYRAIAAHTSLAVGKWLFGVVSVLFFVAVLDVVALARSVLMHGVARARAMKVRELPSRAPNRDALP